MSKLKLEFEIDEATLEVPIRAAVSHAVNRAVQEAVAKKIANYSQEISNTVEVYLNKRYTDEKIRDLIHADVKAWVAEKVRQMESRDFID